MARQHRRAIVDVEHRDGEAALAHMHPEFQIQGAARALRRKPGADASRPSAHVGGRRDVVSATATATTAAATAGRDLHRCLLAAASASVAAPPALARVAAAVGAVRDRLRRLLLSRFATRQVSARAVSYGDEQRGHMLAVLVRFLKRRAGAVGGDAFAAQPYRHLVRLRIRALHATLGVRLVQADVVDDLALFVVETAEEGAGTEQATETAVGEGGKSVCK